MEPERNAHLPKHPDGAWKNGAKNGAKYAKRHRVVLVMLALALTVSSCGRSDEGPLPPHSPPRPTTQFDAELTHAHFHFPARPRPPVRGMM